MSIRAISGALLRVYLTKGATMINTEQSNTQLILGALFALAVDWESAETRTGRRGQYQTTGASMFRIRELSEDERAILEATCAALGMELAPEDLDEIFQGEFEYQVSFACNRFSSKGSVVSGVRLTSNEMRTIERLKAIAEKKPEAVRELLQPRRAA